MTGRGVGSGALLAFFFRDEDTDETKNGAMLRAISDSLSLRECRLLIEILSLRIIASPWILERAARFFFEGVRIGMNRANLAKRFFCAIEYLEGEVAILEIALRCAHRGGFWPTSKMSHDATWRDSWLCRNRDRSWRWLWRLVRLLFQLLIRKGEGHLLLTAERRFHLIGPRAIRCAISDGGDASARHGLAGAGLYVQDLRNATQIVHDELHSDCAAANRTQLALDDKARPLNLHVVAHTLQVSAIIAPSCVNRDARVR